MPLPAYGIQHAPEGYVLKSDLPPVAGCSDINLSAADNVIDALFASDDLPSDWLTTVEDVEKSQPCSPVGKVRSQPASPTVTSIDVHNAEDEMDVPEEPLASENMSNYPVREKGISSLPQLPPSGMNYNAPALWFELTETFDDDTAANDSNFGLDADNWDQISHQFCEGERLPDTLKYELTEDLGPSTTDWNDSDFGFSDQQLEMLWKRFGTQMGGASSGWDPVHGPPSSNPYGTPAPKTLEMVEEGEEEECPTSPCTPGPKSMKAVEEECSLPCTEALQIVEDALANVAPKTLEDFLGEAVPELPRAGMRAWMVSTHNFDGDDWYLFQVNDRSANRFYMKVYEDFEEFHAELEKVSMYRGSCELPELSARDFFGVMSFFGGADFKAQRTSKLKTYVSELMSRPLSPAQEQVVRLFFGPNARGRIMPPKGPVHRGLAYGSRHSGEGVQSGQW